MRFRFSDCAKRHPLQLVILSECSQDNTHRISPGQHCEVRCRTTVLCASRSSLHRTSDHRMDPPDERLVGML
jgi:hypothetical protein